MFSASFDEAKLFKKMKEKMTEFISLNNFKNKK